VTLVLGFFGLYINQFGLQKDNKIFNISKQQALRIVKKAVLKFFPHGIKRAHTYVLRNSFAVYYFSHGVAVMVVRFRLGIKTYFNLSIYSSFNSEYTEFFELLEF
jgi:site-specific recombinase XerD